MKVSSRWRETGYRKHRVADLPQVKLQVVSASRGVDDADEDAVVGLMLREVDAKTYEGLRVLDVAMSPAEARDLVQRLEDLELDGKKVLPLPSNVSGRKEWNPADWYAGLPVGDGVTIARHLGITAATTDAQFAEIERREQEDAEEDDAVVVGLGAYLRGLRDGMKGEKTSFEVSPCIDHWHCDPNLAAHKCDESDRNKPCPSCGARR